MGWIDQWLGVARSVGAGFVVNQMVVTDERSGKPARTVGGEAWNGLYDGCCGICRGEAFADRFLTFAGDPGTNASPLQMPQHPSYIPFQASPPTVWAGLADRPLV